MKVILLFAAVISTVSAARTRIIGGKPAAEGQFPHQVSIGYYGSHFCGGAIIDETTIITAAHCVESLAFDALTTRTGLTKLTDDGKMYSTDAIIVHEDYEEATLKNDIALLKLSSPIEFDDKVAAIALPHVNIDTNEDVVHTGWGRDYPIGYWVNQLRYVQSQTIDMNECRLIMSQQGREVNEKHVCAFSMEGVGACHGDSGGPLTDGAGKELVGVASWGFSCGKAKPDVFTRVYSYLDWINSHK